MYGAGVVVSDRSSAVACFWSSMGAGSGSDAAKGGFGYVWKSLSARKPSPVRVVLGQQEEHASLALPICRSCSLHVVESGPMWGEGRAGGLAALACASAPTQSGR